VSAPTDSAVARLIDGYERAVKRLRPQTGLQLWHLVSGGFFGFMAALIGMMPLLVHRHSAWWLVAAATVATALLQAALGRGRWNRLCAQCFEAQRQLVRGNLLDHELLLLAMEEELPARFDKLRYVAQSHGKTRARNYMELRKGSMADRIQWLVENYRALCPPLGLRPLTPALAARRWRLQALLLAPVALMGLGIGLLAVLQTQGLHPLIQYEMPAVMGCCIWLLGCGLGPLTEQQELERGALLSVLVELLDLTNPEPVSIDDDASAGESEAGAAPTSSTARQRVPE
jgi:hypothetical protein